MKNLFNFATKELSQDAFLRWIFENYDCENESVKLTCRKLFDSFTSDFKEQTLDFDRITKLKTFAQWKKIDITVDFEIDGNKYMICIEDKTDSNEHDQLENYNNQIDLLNSDYLHIFKIFYKTNIIDPDERSRVEKQGWKIYDIYDIAPLFSGIRPESEVLGFYIESVNSILNSTKRTASPDEWNFTAWHSFFNDYKTFPGISEYKDIQCYRKAYFYMKLFAENHLTDMPCLEIRSKDFLQKNGRFELTAHIVLYNYEGCADRKMIDSWQKTIGENMPDFVPSYRSDVLKHKQIGKITRITDNTENGIKKTLDEISKVLLALKI